MNRIASAVAAFLAVAVAASAAFALTDTPNCSAQGKTSWVKCVFEESSTRGG